MAEIILAENSGFCFGVKEAINKTENELKRKQAGEILGDVYTLGSLIHNAVVTDDLKARGVMMTEDISTVKAGDVVVIRSHGEPPKTYEIAKQIGAIITDATCPFVAKIHDLVKDAYDAQKQVVVIGDSKHPEVIGINGWCQNSAIIINSKDETEALEKVAAIALEKEIFIVCQTTIQKQVLDEVLAELGKLNVNPVVKNTICNATSVRQQSCEKLSKECDCMVIVGDKNSSNTKKLFEIAKKNCKNSYFCEKANDLILQEIQKYNKIGVAAGASTPECKIKEVIATMSENKIMSMEELMASEGYDLEAAMKLPRLGEVVNGTVHQVTEKQVVVDMGCKKDGVIPKEEVTLEGEQKLTDLFKAGDEIQAKVIKTDDGEGVITLSRKKLEVVAHWKEIQDAYENGTTLKVKIVRTVTGGVIGQYKEASGYIHLSQLSDKFVENAEEYIGKELDVKVTKIDTQKNRASFSHKQVEQEEKKAKLAAIWENLNVDDVVEGKVMRFTDYGAFIDLGGIDGLLHISEISWGKLKHPQELLKIGDTVKVKILSMNQEKGKISLGLKQTTPEPWSVINEKYEVGQVVEGKVVQIKDYGAFVELEPGLDGLVHISEIAHKRVTNIAEEISVGQTVEVKILEINTEMKRIGLSIKATQPAPEKEEVVEEAPVEA